MLDFIESILTYCCLFARSAGNDSIKLTQFTKMIPFFQSLFMSWSCIQCQMACYLGRAAECDDPALQLVSGEPAHTSVFDGQQGRSGRTLRDRTWRELTGSSDSSVRDSI